MGAFRQKDVTGQGGAHCGQRVENGPAGFCIGHPWTCSSGRCRNFPSVWIQPRLTLAWADDHGGWVIVICFSLLGQQLGDPPAPWLDAGTNTLGGILYISTGALVVEFYTNALGPPPARDAGLTMGSFSLITGCLLLTDALLVALYRK